MEPPKHKHKKVPRAPADDPVPVLHSPPRKVKQTNPIQPLPALVSMCLSWPYDAWMCVCVCIFYLAIVGMDGYVVYIK